VTETALVNLLFLVVYVLLSCLFGSVVVCFSLRLVFCVINVDIVSGLSIPALPLGFL